MGLTRCLLGKHLPLKQFRRTKFYITIPEFPDGHVSNENLIPPGNKLPNFNDVDIIGCYFDMGKQCLKLETGIDKLAQDIIDEKIHDSIEDIALEIEKKIHPLIFFVGTMQILHDSHAEFTSSLITKILKRSGIAVTYVNRNETIHKKFKQLSNADVSGSEKKYVDKYFRNVAFTGFQFEEKGILRLIYLKDKLDNLKKIFNYNVEHSSALFTHTITRYEEMLAFPSEIRYAMCKPGADPDKGPWVFTLHPALKENFFKYCSSEVSRYLCWHAVVTAASSASNKTFDNISIVEGLKVYRNRYAKHFGNKNGYADFMLKHSLGVSADEAMSAVKSLKKDAYPKYEDAVDEIEEKASKKQKRDLQMCDIPYWRRILQITSYGDVEKEILQYLPFDHVWERTLDWFGKLFDIKIERIYEHISTWDPAVEFYNVVDKDGTLLGSFYLDPVRRNINQRITNNATNILIRPRSKILDTLPLAALMGGFRDDNNSLISLNTLSALLESLGSILQDIIPQNIYYQFNTSMSMEIHGMYVTPLFFQHWLKHPGFLQHITKHVNKDQPLTQSQAKNIANSQSHYTAIDVCKDLFITNYDLALNSSQTKTCAVLYQDLWSHYHPIPPLYENVEFSSDIALNNSPFTGCYFSLLYGKAIAADIFSAFIEQPEDMYSLGKLYRETFLNVGGGEKVNDLFQKFRGRQPDMDFINKLPGIIPSSS